MDSKPNYIDVLNRYRKRRSNRKQLFELYDQIKSEHTFEDVKSILCIGPGAGEYDLKFIEVCLPNIKQIVAVEIDLLCADDFEQKCLNKFPQATTKVFRCRVEEWEWKESSKFDVVCAMQVFSDIEPAHIKKIAKQLFSEWLNPTSGVLFYNVVVNAEVERYVNFVQTSVEFFAKSTCASYDPSNNLFNVLLEGGGKLIRKHKYQCDLDFRIFDFDIVPMMERYIPGLTEEGMKEYIDTCLPDGFASYIVEFCLMGCQ